MLLQSHIRWMLASLAVTYHLNFWQNNRDLLRVTAAVSVSVTTLQLNSQASNVCGFASSDNVNSCMVICTFRLIVNINIFYNLEFLMILIIPASVQTEYVDLRGWACLFDRIMSILFTCFENIFLHPVCSSCTYIA